ncbi:hypothetical protein NLJ89_g4851 [Agrocybe chaxingu]|uniref:Autophagy-related protein 17 n=1 Tax=Agrocybe chaxingu TaxID=84603 RepID=A0A9W8MVJ8_9AGAR|nr:hypothetical protein NLJ89_g4851 [Agrocybe chaxingu]
MEKDRSRLDKILGTTGDFPERLIRTINSIHSSLPAPEPGDRSVLKQTQDIVTSQEHIVTTMAGVLENLAGHYDNMAGALKDTEAGEAFSEEELQVMNRDTEELSTIMAELEGNLLSIDGYHKQLVTHKDDLQKDLDHLSSVVYDLDELAKIMDDMLVEQDNVDVEAGEQLNVLHHHLTVLDELHAHYVSYRMAFNKLILEMARRRQYREAAENIVRGMMRQLESMTEEETHVRAHFNAEYGSHLPDDLCLCISDPPTRWEVAPLDGTSPEVLPEIDRDIIAEASERVGYSEGPPGAESLTVEIPFASPKHAAIARQVIEVDAELQPQAVQRTLCVQDDKLIATFRTLTVRLARLTLNAFLENVDLVVRTIEHFGKDAEERTK